MPQTYRKHACKSGFFIFFLTKRTHTHSYKHAPHGRPPLWPHRKCSSPEVQLVATLANRKGSPTRSGALVFFEYLIFTVSLSVRPSACLSHSSTALFYFFFLSLFRPICISPRLPSAWRHHRSVWFLSNCHLGAREWDESRKADGEKQIVAQRRGVSKLDKRTRGKMSSASFWPASERSLSNGFLQRLWPHGINVSLPYGKTARL